MKKLMHILLLSCLKATELIEKKLHFSLSRREKIQLNIHKSMCKACSNYEKQTVIIEKGIANLGNIENLDLSIDMDLFKKSILEKIENN